MFHSINNSFFLILFSLNHTNLWSFLFACTEKEEEEIDDIMSYNIDTFKGRD